MDDGLKSSKGTVSGLAPDWSPYPLSGHQTFPRLPILLKPCEAPDPLKQGTGDLQRLLVNRFGAVSTKMVEGAKGLTRPRLRHASVRPTVMGRYRAA